VSAVPKVPKDPFAPEGPNPEIDAALANLMRKIGSLPPDVAVKVINAAISWEKVRHQIKDKDEEFDPDEE
jgi:hypothetical protein